MKHRDDKMLNL